MTVIDDARRVDVHEGAGPLPGGVLRLLDGWLPRRRWYPVLPDDDIRHVPWRTVTFPPTTAPGGADGDASPGGPRADVVAVVLRLSGPGYPAADDEATLLIQAPLVLLPADAGPAGAESAGAESAGADPIGTSPGSTGPASSSGRTQGETAHAPADPPPADRAASAESLIGVVETPDGPVAVHDGGVHPAAWHAYLAAALPGAVPDADEGLGENAVPGDAWWEGAHPLGGEQSNSSVIVPGLRPPVPGFPGERSRGVILKILRTVPLGPHPDVVIPEALTRAGWDGVPRYLGAVGLPRLQTSGAGAHLGGTDAAPAHRVPVSGGAQGRADGMVRHAQAFGIGDAVAHLAVVSELISGADDGFELACAHASEGLEFDEEAATLGAVVAHMHAALAAARPTDATLDPSGFMGVLRRRATEAIADVAELAPHRGAITAFYDEVSDHLTAVGATGAIPLQAIHGDLHLGQVLRARDGWKVLDFEGEPQRPVAERTAPDLPLRDVAGVLRSFDYAAAVGGAADPEWSGRAQLSFLEGYRETLDATSGPRRPAPGRPTAPGRTSGPQESTAPDRAGTMDVTTASLLLRALTLDKALYETVYESRHRPDWLHIPLTATARTLAP